MIGIIGAMAEEVAELKNIMTDTLEHKIGDMTFVSGRLCGDRRGDNCLRRGQG